MRPPENFPMPNLNDVLVPPPDDGEVIDPMAWFDSPGPFEIEIGSGKGGFLLSRAKAHPRRRFLGIEWATKYARSSADRMARWNLANVRIMRTDARFFFLNHLPPACVDTLHLYHPDPWPKKRHHKRRLVQPDFVEAVLRVMVPGAEWLVQSDHEAYFEVIRAELDARPELTEVPWADAAAKAGDEWAGTNFEIKYVAEGRPIHRAAYLRGAVSQPVRSTDPRIEATAVPNSAAGRTR